MQDNKIVSKTKSKIDSKSKPKPKRKSKIISRIKKCVPDYSQDDHSAVINFVNDVDNFIDRPILLPHVLSILDNCDNISQDVFLACTDSCYYDDCWTHGGHGGDGVQRSIDIGHKSCSKSDRSFKHDHLHYSYLRSNHSRLYFTICNTKYGISMFKNYMRRFNK